MTWLERIRKQRQAAEPIDTRLAIDTIRIELLAQYRKTNDDRYLDLQQHLQRIANAKDPLAEMASRGIAAPQRQRG